MRALIALLALSLAACSTITPQESQLIQAQLSRPTFKVECPTQGCNFERFEYYDPNQQIRMPTNGYDLANKLIDTVGGIAVGVAPYVAISEGFKYMNSSQTTTTTDSSSVSNSETNTATTTTTTTSDSNNSSVTETTTSESPIVVPPVISNP